MNTWLIIFTVAIGIYFLEKFYRLIEKHNNKIHQTYIGIYESHQKAMELLSVSTIAGSIVSRALFDKSLNDQIHKLESDRMDILFAPFKGSEDNKISHKEAEEIKNNIDQMLKRLNVYNQKARGEYISLAWNIYSDVKRYNK